MKYIKILFLSLLAAVACQKLDYPEADASNELSSLKCYVYYDSDNLKSYETLDVLAGGTFNDQMGAIIYTFPSGERFTSETLTRCRLEATIPSTARLVETDAQGNELGSGIGGFRNFSAARTTIYFKVVAADGSEKKYQAQFQFNK
jgi:hypothetical protein